jgi:hypothetical protein
MIHSFDPVSQEPLVKLEDAQKAMSIQREEHYKTLEEIDALHNYAYVILALVAVAAGVAMFFF